MQRRWLTPALLVPLLALSSCDTLGPDRGNTRIVASRMSGTGANQALIPTGPVEHRGGDDGGERNRGALLALVEDLSVTVTAVQALPAQYLDRPNPERFWETMTLAAPVTVNLLTLPTEENGGVELFDGDLPPGAYVRLRLLVSEIAMTLAAPLTLGGHTFPAGEPLAVSLEDPWVRIPGAFFTVADDETTTVDVFFDPGSTIGRLVVTPDGQLRFVPVMRGKFWRDDHWPESEGSDDDDDDDEED
jgi:hypothetical protein